MSDLAETLSESVKVATYKGDYDAMRASETAFGAIANAAGAQMDAVRAASMANRGIEQLQVDTVLMQRSAEAQRAAAERLDAIRNYQISYRQNILAKHGNDTIQIGDIIFGMPASDDLAPPSVIRIDNRIYNYKWNTLRSKYTDKVPSGRSNARVAMSIYFIGQADIDSGLRRLIATFNSVPFVYVENKFLRSVLSPKSTENMAFSFVSLNVRTEPGLPTVLIADIDLLWFNYRPYAPDFLFRRKWQSILEQKKTQTNEAHSEIVDQAEKTRQPVKALIDSYSPVLKKDPAVNFTVPAINPRQSEPYVDYVTKHLGATSGKLTNAINFRYREYVAIAGMDPSEADAGSINKKLLRTVAIGNLNIGPDVDMRMNPEAADKLEELADWFYKEFRRPIRVSSCFRSREKQEKHFREKPQTAARYSWHEVGLAVDIPASQFTMSQYYKFVAVARERFGFVNLGEATHHTPTWNVDGSIIKPGWENWHYNFVRKQNEYKRKYGKATASSSTGRLNTRNAIQQLSNDIFYGSLRDENGNELSDETKDAKNKQYRAGIAEKIRELEQSGWTLDQVDSLTRRIRSSSSMKLYFYRPRNFYISDQDTQLIPQGISIAKHNVLPEIPLQGHQYATQHFMGSGDADAVISFVAVGDERLRELQAAIEMLQDNARDMREIRIGSVLNIENPIFGLMGFESGYLENMTIESIEGSPDLYSVQMHITQYQRPEPRLIQEKTMPSAFWREVARYVYGNLVSASGGWQQELKRWAHVSATLEGVQEAVSEEGGLIAESMYSLVEHAGSAGALDDIGGLSPQAYGQAYTDYICYLMYPKEVRKYIYKDGEFPPWATEKQFKPKDTDLARILLEYAHVLLLAIRDGLYHEYARQLEMTSRLDWIDQTHGEPQSKDDRLFVDLQSRLRILGSKIYSNSLYHDGPFRPLGVQLEPYLQQSTRGLEAHPDLDLPPHPLTKQSIDTPPDYWFYNESIDGQPYWQVSKQTVFNKVKERMRVSYAALTDVMSADDFDKYYMSYNKPEIYKLTTNYEGQTTEAAQRAAGTSFDESGIGISLAGKNVGKKIKMSAKEPVYSWKDGQVSSKNNKFHKSKFFKSQGTAQVVELKDDDEVEFGPSKADQESEDILLGKEVEEEHVYGQTTRRLEKILESSYANFDDSVYRLARAYPTYKLYFIEDDANDVAFDGIRNFDDFYSYSAIKDIRFVNSRKWPASLLVVSISNVHGELDTLVYRHGDSTDSSEHVLEKWDPLTVNTKQENPFSKLVLMEGTQVQLKLGYQNDPNGLETIFNGQVVEVGISDVSPDIIQLVCQSYGAELVAEEKTLDSDSYDHTRELLSSMICSPELLHFGRWSRNAVYDPAEMRTKRDFSSSGLFYLGNAWRTARDQLLLTHTFLNSPQDDNIYAPAREEYESWAQSVYKHIPGYDIGKLLGIWHDNSEYWPNQVTVWDIFKEMELRHPGYIALPVPYGQRYTMFFGPPTHGYWARPLTGQERLGWEEVHRTNEKIFGAWLANGAILGDSDFEISRQSSERIAAGSLTDAENRALRTAVSQQELEVYKQRLEWLVERRHQRYRPFRNYHYLSSEHNIIANNMYASAHGVFNAIDLTYSEKAGVSAKLKKAAEKLDASGGGIAGSVIEALQDQVQVLKMKADDNIEDKDTRVMTARYMSCNGEYFARRYAVSLLMRSLRDVYKGKITVLGNPKIKPYDVLYLYDTQRDMYGSVEVEQVTHILSHDTGFITEIKPDMIVAHNNMTTQCTLETMWQMANQLYGDLQDKVGDYHSTDVMLGSAAAGIMLGKVGLALALFGGYKLANWSQGRQPILITPVIERGKPLVAGLAGYKHDNLLVSLKGRWSRFAEEAGEGFKKLFESNMIGDFFIDRFGLKN